MNVNEYPTVGIVTPAYNAARFLSRTIDSLLSQDYPYIDYIVLDNQSTDGTLEILKSYSGRVRYISEPDAGQADAINRGFQKTRGEIFTFLNADDTYLPGAVSKIVRHFMANPGVGLIYGEACFVGEKDETIERYPTRPFSFEKLCRECFICQPAAFMLREAFARAGMMDVNLHCALDYELWMRISKLYPVLKVDDHLATSRMYPANKTLRMKKQVYREAFSATEKHFGYVPFEWIIGYACYLHDGKDQFFERARPTLIPYALSLLLGWYYNPRQIWRYWRDWTQALGVGQKFTGRWDDGWIPTLYESEHDVGKDCSELLIQGRHEAPIRGALRLTVAINGKQVAVRNLTDHGPFEIRVSCAVRIRGGGCRLEIEANKTFRPMRGDYRRLSCIIDSVVFQNRSSTETAGSESVTVS